MSVATEIKRDIEYYQGIVSRLQVEYAEAMKRSLIRCTGCGKRTRVDRLKYIQSHHYVEPYSCTGGDYWVADEGHFQCPKCGKMNRNYDNPKIEELKPYFLEIVDIHTRNWWYWAKAQEDLFHGKRTI